MPLSVPMSSRLHVAACGLAFGLAGALPASAASTTPPEQVRAIETLADALQQRFVYPEQGQHYADSLRAHLAAGDYAGLADTKALAQRLTQDLQAVAPDGHLRVDADADVAGPGPGPRRRMGPPPNGAPKSGPAPSGAPEDGLPSVAETKWIADGVAYLRFNQFAGEPASIAAMQAFVRDYAGARAIIIDTRTLTRGGGVAEMDVLFPQLFARQTVLVDMAVPARDDGPQPAPSPSLREVAGTPGMRVMEHVAVPDPAGPRLANAKVFYLTSARTRSAGEHFAMALQATHRGTIIGERTAGANHFGGFEPIGAGMVAFIPVGRTYDPRTGKDWEGIGIVPDIAVPADEALARALRMAQ